MNMIEMRKYNGKLQYRQRTFYVDNSGAFCSLTEFGDWEDVPIIIPESNPDSERNLPANFDQAH